MYTKVLVRLGSSGKQKSRCNIHTEDEDVGENKGILVVISRTQGSTALANLLWFLLFFLSFPAPKLPLFTITSHQCC